MNRISACLAAYGGIRQVNASLHADAAADAAEQPAHAVWRAVLALLRREHNPWAAQQQARVLFARLLPLTVQAVAQRLQRVAVWGHHSAAANLARTLPKRLLQAAVVLRGRHDHLRRDPAHQGPVPGRPPGRLGESQGPPARADGGGPGRQSGDAAGHRRAGHLVVCPERDGAERRTVAESDADGGSTWNILDLLAPFRDAPEPAVDGSAADLAALLFQPPDAATIDRVVYSHGWWDRLAAGTRLASPDLLASILATGVAQGKSHRDIARDLLPAVDGVRASARRVARTECLRVAGDVQMQAHEQLGDIVTGFQIHCTLDQFTRPAHASRSGTIYYKRSGPGQQGLHEMPRPPAEADGSIAWNCRCFLTPVLSDPGGIADDPVFLTAEKKLVPDPLTYATWWQAADDRRRKVAVGTRRFHAVRDALGHEPRWEHFLGLDGALLPLDVLKAETPVARQERLAKVAALLAPRREGLRQTALYGFIPGGA